MSVCVCVCVCVCVSVCVLQMFLAAMSFVYFAKAFQGSYMKSSITQIERRFDIPSSLIGLIDGSFEIGEKKNICLGLIHTTIHSHISSILPHGELLANVYYVTYKSSCTP